MLSRLSHQFPCDMHPHQFSPSISPQLYERALGATHCGIVISDMNLPDRPIIYCNDAFVRITGYSQSEVIGHNCRFLQGQDSDPKTVTQLRRAVDAGQEIQVVLKNYRKDGTPFWNELLISPVYDARGHLTHYIGIQQDVTQREKGQAIIRDFARRESLVGQMAQRIRQSLSLDEVLNTAVEEVRRVLTTDRVVLYRFNPDWSGDVVVESVLPQWKSVLGKNYQDTCFQANHAVHYRQGRVRSIPNIYQAGLTPCHIKLLEQCQVKANLIVPVLQGETLWGLLLAHHCESPRQWQDAEIELLQQISVQLAIVIQQAALFERKEVELEEKKRAEVALRQSEQNLKNKAEELEKTLQELRCTQAQLVQSEKMSSLGQLVAGVAHEINNPVSFIAGNVKYASDYTQDLLALIDLYQQHYPDPVLEIRDQLETMEFDFLAEDFPKLLKSMKMGTDRIQSIVQSLRNFSRLDEAECKQVDLHEGIDNALMILQYRFKKAVSPIRLTQEYSKLPKLNCYPGQLNQVYMNLISNAIDALEEAEGLNRPPEITIRTETVTEEDHSYAVVRILDNGIGILPEVKARIFDPFYTTKPVGKGTGLGLSISYQIVVEKHQGQLECHSTDLGTEFVIKIPYS